MPDPGSNIDLSSSFSEGRGFVVSGTELWVWWQEARQAAIATNVPPDEANWLLQAFTNLSALELRLGSFKGKDQVWLQVSFAELVQRWQQRLHDRVPVQYLAGKVDWREFVLSVSPAVLIPRPETELLIDLAVAALNTSEFVRPFPPMPLSICDLGTGSGAIALGLATECPTAMIHAVDCSDAALAIARFNAGVYQLGDRIRFYQGSWFEPLAALKGTLSGMIANPPYIPSSMVPELQPEVCHHEPHLALNGGTDGLDAIRQLVEMAPDYLRSGGIWLVEMMAGQADEIAQLLNQNGNYHQIQIHKDLAGLDRFAFAYLN